MTYRGQGGRVVGAAARRWRSALAHVPSARWRPAQHRHPSQQTQDWAPSHPHDRRSTVTKYAFPLLLTLLTLPTLLFRYKTGADLCQYSCLAVSTSLLDLEGISVGMWPDHGKRSLPRRGRLLTHISSALREVGSVRSWLRRSLVRVSWFLSKEGGFLSRR